MSWQHGGWQRRQQEGGGGTGEEEEEDLWKKMSRCIFSKSHTGDKAICPDRRFVPAEMSSVCFYSNSLILAAFGQQTKKQKRT